MFTSATAQNTVASQEKFAKEPPESLHHPENLIQEDRGKVEEKPGLHEEVCATRSGTSEELLISRDVLSVLFLEAFIIQYNLMWQPDFHTNWIPKLLTGIKNTNSWAVCVL